MLINKVSPRLRLTAALPPCLTPAGPALAPGAGTSEALPEASVSLANLLPAQQPSPAGPLPRVPMKQRSKRPRHFEALSHTPPSAADGSLLWCEIQYRASPPAGDGFAPCRPQTHYLLSPTELLFIEFWLRGKLNDGSNDMTAWKVKQCAEMGRWSSERLHYSPAQLGSDRTALSPGLSDP